MSYETDEKKPISVGPWGGSGGSQFDEIREFVVVHEPAINSTQQFVVEPAIKSTQQFVVEPAIKSTQQLVVLHEPAIKSTQQFVVVPEPAIKSTQQFVVEPAIKSTQQFVVVHEPAIKSTQIKFDKKRSSVRSDKHGEDEGTKIEKVVYGVVKEPVPSGPHPWGGDGGRQWDEGIFSGMKPIFIISGQVNINIHYKGASDYFDTNLSMTGTGNLYSLPSTQSAQRGHT